METMTRPAGAPESPTEARIGLSYFHAIWAGSALAGTISNIVCVVAMGFPQFLGLATAAGAILGAVFGLVVAAISTTVARAGGLSPSQLSGWILGGILGAIFTPLVTVGFLATVFSMIGG